MTDVASRAYQPTPLHARTAELCVTNAWSEECGFTVPAIYTSLREEEDALTTRVALSDLSARQCWLFDGPDAGAFLSYATISDVSRLELGQTARTVWLDDTGFVRGEGLIARFDKAQFELWTSVRDFTWFADGAKGFEVKATNATGTRAVIGVRGPLAPNLLAATGLSGESAAAAGVVRPSWRPPQLALMRGASGDGVELWMQADDAVLVWDRLWRTASSLGVAAVGAAALDVARIESGTAKPGIDWTAAQLAHDGADLRLPSDLGYGPDAMRRFNGADALRRTKGQGRVLVQFTADEPMALGPLVMRGITVGRITSQAWSESRACAVALGWLDADAVKLGTKLSAPGPGGPVRAEIVRPLFLTK